MKTKGRLKGMQRIGMERLRRQKSLFMFVTSVQST